MKTLRNGILASLAAVLVAVGGLTAVAFAAGDPWDAEDCTLSVDENNVVTLDWTRGEAEQSQTIWRNGRAVGAADGLSSYTDADSATLSGIVHYSILSRGFVSLGEVQEPREYCGKVDLGAPGGGTAETPASCSVTVTSSGGFEVAWAEANGADTYVISRSVNGSPFFWRGRDEASPFTDGARSGSVIYQVASRSSIGTRSAPVQCDGVGDPVAPCRTQIANDEARRLALPRPPAVDGAILAQLPSRIDSAYVAPNGWVYYVHGEPQDEADFLERVNLANGVTERIATFADEFQTYEIQAVDASGAAYITWSFQTGASFERYSLDGTRTDLGDVESDLAQSGTYTEAIGNLADGSTVLVSRVDGSIAAVEVIDAAGQRRQVSYPANDFNFAQGLTADGDLITGDENNSYRLDLDCNR